MIYMLAEGVPVAVHYHHAWLVWLLYFTGVALHVALQVNDIAAKNKWTRQAVMLAIGPAVAYRIFGTTMVFGLIWHYPLAIPSALKAVGINIDPDEAAVLAIPMNNFVAGLYGLVLDSLLGYVPGLKSWLPPVNPAPPANPAQEMAQP